MIFSTSPLPPEPLHTYTVVSTSAKTNEKLVFDLKETHQLSEEECSSFTFTLPKRYAAKIRTLLKRGKYVSLQDARNELSRVIDLQLAEHNQDII